MAEAAPPGETPAEAVARIGALLEDRFGAACWAFDGARGEPGATAFALRHPPSAPDAPVFLVVPRAYVDGTTASLTVPAGAASHGESRRVILAEPAKWFAPEPPDVAIAPLSLGPWADDAVRRGYAWTPPALSLAGPAPGGPWAGGACVVLGRRRSDGPAEALAASARAEGAGLVLALSAPGGFAGAPVFALLPAGRHQLALGLAGALAADRRTLLPGSALDAAINAAVDSL